MTGLKHLSVSICLSGRALPATSRPFCYYEWVLGSIMGISTARAAATVVSVMTITGVAPIGNIRLNTSSPFASTTVNCTDLLGDRLVWENSGKHREHKEINCSGWDCEVIHLSELSSPFRARQFFIVRPGDIGDNLVPNGLSTGCRVFCSKSIYPRSYRIRRSTSSRTVSRGRCSMRLSLSLART
jgi:hypothetical protein